MVRDGTGAVGNGRGPTGGAVDAAGCGARCGVVGDGSGDDCLLVCGSLGSVIVEPLEVGRKVGALPVGSVDPEEWIERAKSLAACCRWRIIFYSFASSCKFLSWTASIPQSSSCSRTTPSSPSRTSRTRSVS